MRALAALILASWVAKMCGETVLVPHVLLVSLKNRISRNQDLGMLSTGGSRAQLRRGGEGGKTGDCKCEDMQVSGMDPPSFRRLKWFSRREIGDSAHSMLHADLWTLRDLRGVLSLRGGGSNVQTDRVDDLAGIEGPDAGTLRSAYDFSFDTALKEEKRQAKKRSRSIADLQAKSAKLQKISSDDTPEVPLVFLEVSFGLLTCF